jgi:HNH endonuclease
MLKRYPLPTRDRLNELFHYDENIGVLFWKERPIEFFIDQRSCDVWNTRQAGKPAGNVNHYGYLRITLDKKSYFAHRIVWKMKTGEEPVHIDHRDMDKLNNRFENLRAAEPHQNSVNSLGHKGSFSGLKNVSFCARSTVNPWYVLVSHAGKRHYCGSFATKEEAFSVACAMRSKLQGEFARHGPEQP